MQWKLSKKGSLWEHYRDESNDTVADFKSFKFEQGGFPIKVAYRVTANATWTTKNIVSSSFF